MIESKCKTEKPSILLGFSYSNQKEHRRLDANVIAKSLNIQMNTRGGLRLAAFWLQGESVADKLMPQTILAKGSAVTR
jgi:hypothetical protein